MRLDLKAKCPDSGPCLSQKRVDDAWDMEGFLYMKKMFILRECGYWRSHMGTGITPNKIS
jgi:hypothetical protein